MHSKGGKGKGSSNPSQCPSCTDGSVDITSITPPPYIQVSAQNEDGTTTDPLFRGCVNFESTFLLQPTIMPDCITVEVLQIDDKKVKVVQTVSIDVSCCANDTKLKIGDSVGALTVVQFNENL